MDPQEAKVCHPLHTDPADGQWCDLSLLSPVVYYELFCLCSVKEKVVGRAPIRQPLHFFSVGGLIPPRDKPRHCGVICKLYNGVTVMDSGAVVCVEEVEQGTEHTAPGGASAEAKGCGCVMAHSDCLRPERKPLIHLHVV